MNTLSQAAAPAAQVPPPPLSEEARDEVALALEKTVREWAADRVDARRIDHDAHIPLELLRELAELGLFGLTLPERYGGSELPATVACRAVTALAEFDRSIATTVGLHLGLGTRGLTAFGSQATQERFLPRLAEGAEIAAFATTEPGAGSDLSAIATQGVAVGDQLKLNGQKIYVTNGGLCRVLTATVATPGLGGAARGTSVVVMGIDTKGVSVLGEEHKLGLKGSSTTTVCLDDVEIPMGQVLGEPGRGAEYLSHILSWGRLLLSAGCLGTARKAFAMTREHVQTRKQFGKTLAAQEVVQHQLCAMATRIFAMRGLVQAAARAQGDYEALARLTSSAKVLCSEGAWDVGDLALQLHGGAGYIEETGVALLIRDARVTRIFEGANDVLLTHLGLMELAKPTPGSGVVPQAVENLRVGLTARYGGVRLMGKKAELHRLGQACMWRDAAVAAHALADREISGLTGALASAVEQTALERVRALSGNLPELNAQAMTTLLNGALP